MPWRPLSRIAVAVAIYPFAAISPVDLPLEIGDDLYIIEQGGENGDWFRGYLVAPPSLLSGLTSVKGQTLEARVFSGIFPRCCVEIREHLGDSVLNNETNGFAKDGNPHKTQLANGDPTKQSSPQARKTSIRRKGSIDSVRRKQAMMNGETFKELENNPSLMSASHQTLARKLSHRSVTSSRSRNSPVPTSVALDAVRDPKAKRPQAPVPMLKIGDETPTSTAEPLVDEIASCLREWHSKNLHELLLARRYSTLEKVAELVTRLNAARRQLLHGVLTDQELVWLREEVVWDLVNGNKMLSNEVIVRDPKQRGRLLNSGDSPIELSRLQSSMSLLDRPPVFSLDPISLHHIMVELKDCLHGGLTSPCLVLQLYSQKLGQNIKPLTERFTIDAPTDKNFEGLTASGALKVLFKDLSAGDIDVTTQAGNGLYLVVRVQANTLAQESSPVNEGNGSVSRPSTGSIASSSPMKGGRQSLMWAQKQFGSVRNRNNAHRPGPAASISEESNSTVSDSRTGLDRPTTGNGPRPDTKQTAHVVKRYVGAGLLDLRNVWQKGIVTDHQVSIWTPVAPNANSFNTEDEQWNELIRDLVFSKHGSYSKAKNMERIKLSVQTFDHPDAQELIAKTPTLLQNVTVTPKTGFSGTLSQPRSDIYITVSEASIPSQALLAHPTRGTSPLSSDLSLRNLQLTLEVRKENGDRVEKCIFPSSNSAGQTAWRTTAVSRGEPWHQLIKVVLSTEDVVQSHLIMSIADAPGFPFALGWIPLWTDGAFIRDGSHVPLLYVYDKTTSGSENGQGAYLSFPWNSKSKNGKEREESLTGPVATLKLETELCSTYFSQDHILLGILRWRQHARSEVLSLLKRVTFVPEIDIVKMVGDVFNALFGILETNSGESEFESAVFNALVVVLGIVYDRRFNLGPFVDEYAVKTFDYPSIAPCLIRSYLKLLSNPADPDDSRLLRAAFKVGRQLLKFILCARAKQSLEEAVIGATTQSAFKRDLRNVFRAFEHLIKDQAPTLIGSKTLIMQHIPTWLPELKLAFSEIEILEVITSFISSSKDVQGKLLLYRLILILQLTESRLFSDPGTREKLVSLTPGWINHYWGSDSGAGDQWREQVRLCSTIASSQAEEPGFDGSNYFGKAIQSYNVLLCSPLTAKDVISLLFPTSYPFPSKPTSVKSSFDEARVELAALLAKIAQTPFKFDSGSPSSQISSIISATLESVGSILAGAAFPQTWTSLYVYHHRSMLRILEKLFNVMIVRLIPFPDEADSFNTELWGRYLTTLLTLVRSENLALETFPEQKRRAVWKVAGDVREQGAELLQRSWEVIGWDTSEDEYNKYGMQRLGGFQVQYVPKLVGPIVELCLSVHEGLRSVAVRILKAMIISEWTLNEDLSVVQAEMVESLDQLFKSKNVGESIVHKMFINELLDSFTALARMPLDPLWQAVRDMVSTIDELLELLGSAHANDISENLRIMNTLQLMNFLREMQKEDIFIRYVHQLAEVQSKQGNKTEAGLALALHAEQYTWDSVRVVPLKDPAFPEQPSFERKEQLYFKMIKFFEEGAAWDRALACYQELASQYESSNFDFAKLARTQRSMAIIHEAISKGDWQAPRYFRVIYRGSEFPPSLRNRQFIYETDSNERQSAFAERMRQLHPGAQITLKGGGNEHEDQSIQIMPISLYRDLQQPIYQQPKVVQATRDYIASTHPYRFALTSRRHSPTSDVQDQWIEKTVYSTQEEFPTIMRRSEIVAIDVIRLSPLETAVERTTRKTSELAAMEKRIAPGDDAAFASFYEAIALSIDSSSPASLSQYRTLLPPKPEDEDDDDEEVEIPVEPMQSALLIALLDHVSLLKHCLSRPAPTSHQATYLTLTGEFNRTFAPELAMLAPRVRNLEEDHTHDLFASPLRMSKEVPASTFARTLARNSQPNVNVNVPAGPASPDAQTSEARPRPLSRISFNAIKGSFGSNPSKGQQIQSPKLQVNGAASENGSLLSSRHNSIAHSQQNLPASNDKHSINSGSGGSGPGRADFSRQHPASPSIGNGTSTLLPERPLTSQSNNQSFVSAGSEGRVRKRLSLLGITRTGNSGNNGNAVNGGKKEKNKSNGHVKAIEE